MRGDLPHPFPKVKERARSAQRFVSFSIKSVNSHRLPLSRISGRGGVGENLHSGRTENGRKSFNEGGAASRGDPSCSSAVVEMGPLLETVHRTDLIVTADHRPVRVDRASPCASIQGRAPAVIQTRHHPHAMLVLLREFAANIVATHQHYFQPATAGIARGAGDRRSIAGRARAFSHWRGRAGSLST